MAIKALKAGGIVSEPWYPRIERAHIKELEKTDKEKAAKYKEEAAAFLRFRILSVEESAILDNLESPSRDMETGELREVRYGEACIYACKKGIIGWGNVMDPETGEPAVFEGQKDDSGRIVGASIKDLSCLPLSILREAYTKINALRVVPETFLT